MESTFMDGILVVDKPAGKTSYWVVAYLKRLRGEKRIGHAGTLDPQATGVLVIGLGLCTRVLQYISSMDKVYVGVIKLGESTDTEDAEGQLIEKRDVPVLKAE